MKLSRIFCAIILTSYAGLASAATYQIVSDFDDTVKMTNVDNTKAAICNTLLSNKVFAGVPELYQIFKSHGAPISLVSSGVIHIKFLMYNDLHDNGVPYDAIYLRRFFSEGTLDFKYSRLVKLFKQNKLPFVFVGDDTQLDPDVFNLFRANYGDQALAIYIRNVTGRVIPAGMRRFYTPYEIAVYEYLEGRMSYSDLEKIADKILSVKLPEKC
jgi:phosphatidate phosphatase APP1